MDLQNLKKTELWCLYEKSKNYAYQMGIYADTDKNFRMYNGNQMQGLKIKGIEPVQLNFIRTIVKFKVSSINQNLWAINYSSENYDNNEFRKTADQTCELLNKRASRMWEREKMDFKIRRISTNAAVNGECPVYINWDKETNFPVLEILNRNDVYFGNENNSDIQSQPYILIKQRMPVINAQEVAKAKGVSVEEISHILGDMQVEEQAGEKAKYEVDDMVTIVTKLYKDKGKVMYSQGTQFVDFVTNKDSGLKNYPVAHMIWEDVEGSSRGIGEVEPLIACQLEVNKTLTRRLLVSKNIAYPQRIVNVAKIENPDAVDAVGGTIRVRDDKSVEDVRKVFSVTQPAQMSTDVEKLQQELIDLSRSLANASDSAIGDINPESASGKAILAVQQAQRAPLTEQDSALKQLIEDIARIWFEMLRLYNPNGLKLEQEETNEQTNETTYSLVDIPASVLDELEVNVKIDVTPRSAFDKYAQELTLENLLKGGWFSPQLIGQLEIYIQALPDDSTLPKTKVLEIIEAYKERQARIAQMNAEAQMMKQRANEFLNNDPDSQANQIAEIQAQAMQQGQQQTMEELAAQQQTVMEGV